MRRIGVLIIILILQMALIPVLGEEFKIVCPSRNEGEQIECLIEGSGEAVIELFAVNGRKMENIVIVKSKDNRTVIGEPVELPAKVIFNPQYILMDLQEQLAWDDLSSFQCMLCDKVNYFTFKLNNTTLTVSIYVGSSGMAHLELLFMALLFILLLILGALYSKYKNGVLEKESFVRGLVISSSLFFANFTLLVATLVFYILGSPMRMMSDFLISILYFFPIFSIISLLSFKDKVKRRRNIREVIEIIFVCYSIAMLSLIGRDILVVALGIPVLIAMFSLYKMKTTTTAVFLFWNFLLLYILKPSFSIYLPYMGLMVLLEVTLYRVKDLRYERSSLDPP
ncbi:hypothetical protein [Pyrococcus kukulkanii]|uniref:Uncharacterized protein n=3 Tax=Pyrococcus kukulkanii TaxID=1609559 RepID=A0ABV4T2U5_9EURY